MTLNPDLAAYLDTATEAARRGAAVLEEWRNRFQVREKGRFDLVTEADVTSQKVIREFVLGRHPDHGFLGEEEGASKSRPALDAPPTWIVDPLDGTTNYVHDCPLYCVSIGLQVAGELVVGVVFDPRAREMFRAAKGGGAWLNEQRISVSKIGRMEEALLSTGFPADVRGRDDIFDWWKDLSLRACSLRRTGSTALNLAYVAAGRFDGYWAFDNNAWDVAGGAVLVREAGGQISNVDGSLYDHHTPDAVASNGLLHSLLLECFRRGK
jgi:myo-inositol-1(or 4)-monophosphatase